MAAGPSSDTTVWACDPENMILEEMEDVLVAFHTISGDTHILNFLSAAVIKVLVQHHETVQSATPKILSEIELSKDDCPAGLIVDTFLQLDDVGLITPVSDTV